MRIRALVMDVDGTLTDGRLYIGAQGEVMKAFDAKDGYGIAHLLPGLGIEPVIITGRSSEIVRARCAELGITRLYQGVQDKEAKLSAVCAQLGITPAQCAYIGDDLSDLPCMRLCGVSAAPVDAVQEVREQVSYVCRCEGGRGAVREFIDWLGRRRES